MQSPPARAGTSRFDFGPSDADRLKAQEELQRLNDRALISLHRVLGAQDLMASQAGANSPVGDFVVLDLMPVVGASAAALRWLLNTVGLSNPAIAKVCT